MDEAEPLAHANLARIQERAGPALGDLNKRLTRAMAAGVPKEQRTIQIRFLAGEWSRLVAVDSACRGGCSHCCHINVELPLTEAQLISRKTGAPLKTTKGRPIWKQSDPQKHLGAPCPFLSTEGACRIYDQRPLTCRTLVNLAPDARLCVLRPGETVPVPYANSTALQGAFAAAHQGEEWSDIRDWFGPAPAILGAPRG